MTKYHNIIYYKTSLPNFPKYLEEFKQFVKGKVKISEHIKMRNPPQLEHIFNDILHYWNQNKELNNLSRRLYRKIPLLLPLSFQNKLPLIEDKIFLKTYLTKIEQDNDDRNAKRIFKSILRNYKTYQFKLGQMMPIIRPIIYKSSKYSCKLLADRDRRYGIMHENIVSRISNIMLQSTQSIEDIFLDLCISPDIWEGQLGEAIAIEMLKKNQEQMYNSKFIYLDRTLKYFIKDNESDQIRLEYLRPDILDYLLGPFIESDPQSDNIKDKLSRFIDKYFGDPRVDPRWTKYRYKDEIKHVVLRWKTTLTLKTFFKLLDYVAKTDSTHDRHWKDRKEFWNNYLDKKEILEAWLVLGKVHTSTLSTWNEEEEKLEYATFLNSTGIQRTHSAIIMRIKDYILVEWSHSGALRMYKTTDKRKPKFYKKNYHPDELKKIRQGEEGWIRHSHYGSWQSEVEDMLFSRRQKRKIDNTSY